MNPAEEREWLDQLRSGRGSALRQLMDSYGNDIYRTAFLLLKDRHLAEDISQEAFLAAFRNIRQFNGTGSLKGWLLQITVNLCRGKMRRASWKRLIFREIADYELPSAEPGPEKAADGLSLTYAIRQLPYKYREAIVLHYYQGLSVKEMGGVLEESEGTVKSKLSRGRKLLRAKLEEGGWNDGDGF
ncbi:RNA polymerase sigma factor [Paenibacillus sp. MBLB4367]|uniref:RNA polymerase sigma factor n=1 Tax=Paenibacillus sp. MBLB4367 TaxID=3384767 RepID=UPI003907E7B8